MMRVTIILEGAGDLGDLTVERAEIVDRGRAIDDQAHAALQLTLAAVAQLRGAIKAAPR